MTNDYNRKQQSESRGIALIMDSGLSRQIDSLKHYLNSHSPESAGIGGTRLSEKGDHSSPGFEVNLEDWSILFEQMSSVLEAPGISLWIWDSVRSTFFAGGTLCSLFRIEGDKDYGSLSPKKFLSRLSLVQRREVLQQLKKSSKDGRLFDLEIDLKSSDGEYRVIRSRGRALGYNRNEDYSRNGDYNSKGSGCIIGACWDITERKSEQIRQHALRERLTRLEKINSLSTFAAGTAHDFNNLLTAILTNVEILEEEIPRGDSLYIHVAQIDQASKKLSKLSKQMLECAGGGSGFSSQVNVSQAVSEMLSLFYQASRTSSRLVVNLQPDLPSVKGDSAQIKEVIYGIVVNAFEALTTTHGRIEITTESRYCSHEELSSTFIDDSLPCTNYVILTITDDGCGIPQDLISHIFEPFFTTKNMGRGLSLAACLGVVRRHRGAISVSSIEGQGTAVKVYLPAIIFPSRD